MRTFCRVAASARAVRCLGGIALIGWMGCASGGGGAGSHRLVETIYYNANFVTMDGAHPSAEAVAVLDGTIVAVGSRAEVLARGGRTTRQVDLHGATVFPGFIDTHSHLMGYGIFTDRAHWLDVSNENLLFKPSPGDPRCTTPSDPQLCFIPVTNEDEALGRLAAAVRAAPGAASPVLAFGHDVARLGPSAGCRSTGFACPNLQDGHALAMLDAISTTHPIFVSASSGHFAYVNTPALHALHICGTEGASAGCHQPVSDRDNEERQAREGLLVEDLALYGVAAVEGEIFKHDPKAALTLLDAAARIYQQHGFTTAQEGAASAAQVAIYDLVTRDPSFPLTTVILAYAGTPDFAESIAIASKAKKDHADDPNLVVGGVKTFADGSTQGYSAALVQPYFQVFPPLVAPWFGSADLTPTQLVEEAAAAHRAGFPLAIHMNGDQAIANVLGALEKERDPAIHDLLIHLQVSDPAVFKRVLALGAKATFLIPDLYYYGLPFCEQILDRARAMRVFPLAEAVAAGLPFGLHSDSPVTPPDPLFMIWSAKTRRAQQPAWIPSEPACPEVLGKDETVSIAQGIRAFTVDAADFYGLQDRLGSLAVGKAADLTILSANPLAMEANPDAMKTLRVIATVHRGHYFPNPDADQPPIWPG